MSVTDLKINKNALAATHSQSFPITTIATGQTAALVGAYAPGKRFQVTRVSVFATGVTSSITVDVQIDGVSVLTGQVTPVAGTEAIGTLVASQKTLRGTNASQLQVKYTTNGSGAAVNLVVRVQIRPWPLNGEI
jgi:hypothetical protein